MKGLKDILHGIPVEEVQGSLQKSIERIVFDSREASASQLFVAIRGTQSDGHIYLDQAALAGVSAILCEEMPTILQPEVTYIRVPDTAYALGVAAGNFYDNPSHQLLLVGVTGTNGKTTVATLLYNLFMDMGYGVGLLSTVENRIGERIEPATHTTPNPVALQHLLRQMVDEGCDYCFMEVSSHAVVQQRIAGLKFAGGIFTNISHDHLDFHLTFDHYIEAKKMFFDSLDRAAFALSNQDDRNGTVMLQNTFAHQKYYGLKHLTDFKGKIMESHFDGTLLQIDGHEVWIQLVGEFNAYNVLAVYGAAVLLEQETMKILTSLSRITGAEGRFDALHAPNGVIGIVDYAHTPDAVRNVLETIQKLRKGTEQIVTVLGCGGNRDKSKRPEMAAVAVKYSDKVILTSDNPRNEDPIQIIREMEAGIEASDRRKVFSISDRREAIRAAYHLAQTGDVLLIAGKGHEKYQEIAGIKYPFDDKDILKEAFNERN